MNLRSYIREIRKRGKRSFTIDDVLGEFQVTRNHARVALHRLRASGDVISPARGLYVIVPPEHQPYGSIPAEELVPILMEYLGENYYVALLSAAMFYGAAHQKPARFQIMTTKRMNRSLRFGGVEIQLIYKKSLSDLPVQDFVVETGYLKVATPELVVIDLFSYPHRSGGLNHIATVLSELTESIDADKLTGLSKKLGANHHLQRLGYILERIDVMEEDKKNVVLSKLETFLGDKMEGYVPLAAEIPRAGHPRCKKWRIVENTDVESDL